MLISADVAIHLPISDDCWLARVPLGVQLFSRYLWVDAQRRFVKSKLLLCTTLKIVREQPSKVNFGARFGRVFPLE
jgi:hypothetical protein